MTKRQFDLLRYVLAYIDTNGFSPSYDEIREALGLASKSNVAVLVDALVKRGKLAKHPHKRRSLHVPVQNEALAGFSTMELRKELGRRALL